MIDKADPLRNEGIKALYLSFNVTYINPSREDLRTVLEHSLDLKIHGPGYVSDQELERPISKIVEENGPFDLVITDEYVTQSFEGLDAEDIRFVNHACRFDPRLLSKAIEWREFLRGYDGIRVLTLMQSDYYNFSVKQIEVLEEVADYYICWGKELMISKSEILDSDIPLEGVDADIFKTWNDNFLNFLNANSDRIISCPHWVDAGNFGGDCLRLRKPFYSIVGANYNAREKAREVAAKHGIGLTGSTIRYSFALADKLNFNLHNKYWSVSLMRWLFLSAIRRARYGFTCGSIMKWPINKFFEIPANGAVLLCERPAGFDSLGFQDRINFLLCKAEDVADLYLYLEANPDTAQSIADAGKQLVCDRHSDLARVLQLRSAFTQIKLNVFRGSQWINGNFSLVNSV